jgi:hypothetical protein
MHSTIEEQQERSKAIKLLVERWVKSHDAIPKVQWKPGKYPIPTKKETIDPQVS